MTSSSSNQFQSNVGPLNAYYNMSGDPYINGDKLAEIRSSGNFNPRPLYPLTTDRGNAFSKIKPITQSIKDNNYDYNYVTPSGAEENNNSWYNNGEYYSEYQRYAYNFLRKSDPYFFPYFFSEINVKHIQNKVIEKVKETIGVTIETKQDIEGLLQMMISAYSGNTSGGAQIKTEKIKEGPLEPWNDPVTTMQGILGKLNKSVIERYVRSVLSASSFYNYYITDISNLPVPLSRPTNSSIKGHNELGFLGFFENNHEFTKQIDSYNTRNVL